MVRNCQEIGENLILIIKRLMANNNLVKLLYYNDKDPLSNPDLTEEQKKELVFEKLIKITPRVGPKETANSLIVVRVTEGTKNENNEFRNLKISLEIFVPLTQWITKGTNLRPFAILGEIQKSLENKTVNGLGKIVGGDFELSFLTDEIGCYEAFYQLVIYD